MSDFRRRVAATAVALLAGFGPDAFGTWSIVLADSATGEVAVGAATCWDGQWLQAMQPVVRVGRGAANAQATWDQFGLDRRLIWQDLGLGIDPATTLSLTASIDPIFESRQFGIVDLEGRAVSHTGSTIQNSWKGGIAGTKGTLAYAIQGNLLAGDFVVQSALYAVLNTEGDVATKLMSGMLVARMAGGDGRCSCNLYTPDACGAPPPSFTKAAHVGFMIVARVGDEEGTCFPLGCATGKYFLDFDVGGQQGANEDPVFQLLKQYIDWQGKRKGKPDHLTSTVGVLPAALATGATGRLVIRLRDSNGVPITHGGHKVTVTREVGDDLLTIGNAIDLQDGSYEVPLVAGGKPGCANVRVTVEVGAEKVTLYPFTEVPVAHADAMRAGPAEISSSRGDDVWIEADPGDALAGWPYLILASGSGTSPGTALDGVHVPLNVDSTLFASMLHPNQVPFVNTLGVIAANGAVLAGLACPPHLLDPLVGGTLSLSLVSIGYASEPVSIVVRR